MIKGALAATSFILAVVAIYFQFIQIPEFLNLPHLSVTLVNTTNPDKMTTSISRSVVKKVLAIEQAEVSVFENTLGGVMFTDYRDKEPA